MEDRQMWAQPFGRCFCGNIANELGLCSCGDAVLGYERPEDPNKVVQCTSCALNPESACGHCGHTPRVTEE